MLAAIVRDSVLHLRVFNRRLAAERVAPQRGEAYDADDRERLIGNAIQSELRSEVLAELRLQLHVLAPHIAVAKFIDRARAEGMLPGDQTASPETFTHARLHIRP